MSRPDITWFCGECGYQRGEQHTCPPDEGETIASLVDALPSSPPSPAVRADVEELSDLRRRARPDGLFVREPLLGWLLTGFSYLEVAGEKLRPYTAEGMGSPPAPSCPNCHAPAVGALWWSPRCGAYVCAQCALVHQGESDQAERLAMLRAAARRYLAARDAARPEAEKAARDEIERML